MKSKLLIPLILLCLPILGIFIINRFYSHAPQDSFVEGIVGQPRNLHPLKMEDNPVDRELVSLLYRSILTYGNDGELVGDLAEGWDVGSDGLEYTLYLKKGIRWHDGEEFGADDVIFTVQRLQPLSDVAVEKIDSHTVKFTLSEVYSPFLDLLAVPVAPEHVSLESSPFTVVGTGDFALAEISTAPNFIEEIQVNRIRESGDKSINKLIFKFFNDREELQTAVQLGEVQGYVGGAIEWPGFSLHQAPLLSTYYAVFINLERGGLLADIDFRRDLASATPKERLVTEILNGEYRKIEGPIHESWAEELEVDQYPFAESPAVLYEGEFKLVVPRTRDNQKTAQALKESWEKLGIGVEIVSIDVENVTEEILKKKDFDFLLLGQEVGPDPDRYSFWHSTQTEYPGLNIVAYKQVRVDKALEFGRKELLREDRLEHYSLFQKLIASDVPAIYLYQPYFNYHMRDFVKGVELKNIYAPQDRFRTIDRWHIELPSPSGIK
jgi:peptide/nickel transport system substrate-binding protein